MATTQHDTVHQGSPRELPVGSQVDDALMEQVRSLGEDLGKNLYPLYQKLAKAQPFASYDAALLLARDIFMEHLDELLERPSWAFFSFLQILPRRDCARVCRLLLKMPDTSVRNRALGMLERRQPTDVALPRAAGESWTWRGWARGNEPGRLSRHATGSERQRAVGVPVLTTVVDIKELLALVGNQLGWLLLASDIFPHAPYTTFTIPKRDGREREIAAPKGQLRRAQRDILSHILSKVPIHDAAHGFVKGRSTVTNAAVHRGQAIIVKFDLKDFFPSIHYWRLVGLFASFGYDVGTTRFSTADDSRSVAPVLARLCTFTRDPDAFGDGFAPQGAPTSPAVSNLVCRGLDTRLAGLAASCGGRYSRYADDLTFSFQNPPEKGLGRLRWWVDEISQQEGFVVNHAKFRVIRRSQRQLVTGIVVNDVLRVPRRDRRRFRAILHNCTLHGVASQARGRADFADYLLGYASYINMVHPEEGGPLLEEVRTLLERDGSAQH